MEDKEICTICQEKSVPWTLTTTKVVVLSVATTTFIGVYALITPFVLPALRKICLPFVPATTTQIRNVFKALEGRQGRLLDIGSGDGRIVLEGARRGYQSHGVELNPWLVVYSRLQARRLGLAKLAHFRTADLWKTNLSAYDCIVIFGVDSLMPPLQAKVASELGLTSCVAACRFPFHGSCKPDLIVGSGLDRVWLYTPASFR